MLVYTHAMITHIPIMAACERREERKQTMRLDVAWQFPENRSPANAPEKAKKDRTTKW